MSSASTTSMTMPATTCCWAIHVWQDDYEDISPPSPTAENELEDAEWPQAWRQLSFEKMLGDNLETNDFSNIAKEQLPVAVPQIVAAASHSPDEMLKEAIGFAIIGRNQELLENLLAKVNAQKLDLSELHPYHLAATYIDGSRTCCSMLQLLSLRLRLPNALSKLYTNDRGHTVLDSLFITILRNHTSISPGMVDFSFRKDKRFFGEDLDICGRWEPDSKCWKELTKKGRAAAPEDWKHKFCHTSTQAIFHSISCLSGFHVFNIPSGIFMRFCGGCGLNMQLPPLHALVVVSYCLATSGFVEEDLFGAICCLFGLLLAPLDPTLEAAVSMTELLDRENDPSCTHSDLTPAALAVRLSSNMDMVPETAIVGWRVFCQILQRAERAWISAQEVWDMTEADEQGDLMVPLEMLPNKLDFKECKEYCRERWYTVENFGNLESGAFAFDDSLGHVFAVFKTELGTYRRQTGTDSWTSANFDMRAVLEYVERKKELCLPLYKEKMMREYCCCGRFIDDDIDGAEDMQAFHFSNMDNWERTTFIDDRFIREY